MIRSKVKEITVGLIGNPNCGKTTIFNALTGAHQKTANWSGVTIEKREGVLKHRGCTIRVVDLPGIYSLSAYSLEEIVARNYIIHDQPDVIVNVVDAGNLERNLYLTTQLINIGVKVVLAFNMYDEALNKGLVIDMETAGRLMGMPVVKTIGVKNEGIGELIEKIISVAEAKEDKVRHIHIDYGADIEEEIKAIQQEIWKEREIQRRYSTRWLAIRLLENDNDVQGKLKNYPNFADISRQAEISRNIIEKKYRDEANLVLTERRQGFVTGLLKEIVSRGKPIKPDRSEKIDRVLMNRYLGYPILLVFLWALFQATYTLGEYPQHLIERGITWLTGFLHLVMSPGAFRDLLTEGILGGVGGVIVFLPNILILFLGVSLMEDTGYMARAAFVMDKIMHKLGIHGKSFIPLIMGFGCNVPAIMATRMLENRRDRIITVLINPFMSCSARLPVYVLFAGVFFAGMAGTVILSLYAIGIILAFISARIFNYFFFKGESAPFVMELPPYRLPTIRAILLHMWNRASQYLRKMGGLILIFSIIIWVLSEYPRSAEADGRYDTRVTIMEEEFVKSRADIVSRYGVDSEQSIELKKNHDAAIGRANREHSEESLRYTVIGRLGSLLHPVFEPLGFNWQMGLSLITGVVAKEIVVSTLGVLYSAGDDNGNDEESSNLARELTKPEHGISPLIAYIYMLFVLLYIPCIATIIVIGREIGWPWAAFSVVYNLAITWLVCFTVYNAGLILGFS